MLDLTLLQDEGVKQVAWIGLGHLSTLGPPEPTNCESVFHCGVVHTGGWMSKGYPLCPNVSGGATATGAVVGYSLGYPL